YSGTRKHCRRGNAADEGTPVGLHGVAPCWVYAIDYSSLAVATVTLRVACRLLPGRVLLLCRSLLPGLTAAHAAAQVLDQVVDAADDAHRHQVHEQDQQDAEHGVGRQVELQAEIVLHEG